MRIFLSALALAFAAVGPAYAHPEHDMYGTENPRLMAVTSAMSVVDRLVERGAVEASWRGREPVSANLRQRNDATEWVVTFQNDAIRNLEQRTLYVMLTQGGVYLAANYSGE
ncbi:MAG: DUF6488 family protein [Terricaulis sp.]